MKIVNLNLPSYPLNSFFDPGQWFHKYNHRAGLYNFNAFFWNRIYNDVFKTEKTFKFITDDQDLNTKEVDEYQKLIDLLNNEQNIFSFAIGTPPYFNMNGLVFSSIPEYSEKLPKQIITCIQELLEESNFEECQTVTFSIHSIFETFCMYICMNELRSKNSDLQFAIGTTKFENFYVDREQLIEYLKSQNFNMVEFSKELFDFSKNDKPEYIGIDESKIITLTVFDSKCYWQNCHFCFQSKVVIDKEQADEQLILSKLKFYTSLGVNKFLFLDECYTVEKLNYFADLLLKNNIKIKWFARLRFRKDYPKYLWQKLHEAGLVQILFGIESASQRILKIINKYDYDFKSEVFLQLLKNLKEAGILVHICFIIGFPFETTQDLKMTDNLINMLRKNDIFFSTYINIFQWFDKANMNEDVAGYISMVPQPQTDFNFPIEYQNNCESFWYDKDVVEFQKMYVNQIKKLYWKDILLNNENYFNCINSTGYGLFVILNHWDKYVK